MKQELSHMDENIVGISHEYDHFYVQKDLIHFKTRTEYYRRLLKMGNSFSM